MPGFRRLIYLCFGTLFGALLLWLLLREISVFAVRQALAVLNFRSIALAMASFAVAILIRTLRWRALLAKDGAQPYPKVLLVLIIGYAINNLLPARLGEIVRADLARSVLGLSRSQTLGTIAVERMTDGLAVVGMLAVGLTALSAGAQYATALRYILGIAAGLFGALTMVFYFISGTRLAATGGRLAPLARRAARFLDGLRILRSRNMAVAALLTLPVWCADCTSVWFVLNAVHVTLSLRQLMMTTGIVSLSMLLPTAPGYIGTYQLAFVMAVTSFGYSKVQGFAAATASQIFILGTLSVVGIALMFGTHARLAFKSPV